MRTKLNLTDSEIMNKSWIALNLEMADFPYWDYKAKNGPIKVTDPAMIAAVLGKHKKK